MDPYQLALEAFKANAVQPAPSVAAAASAEPQPEETEDIAAKNPRLHIVEPEADDEVWEKKNERKMGFVLPPRPARGATIAEVYDTWLFDSPLTICSPSSPSPSSTVRQGRRETTRVAPGLRLPLDCGPTPRPGTKGTSASSPRSASRSTPATRRAFSRLSSYLGRDTSFSLRPWTASARYGMWRMSET